MIVTKLQLPDLLSYRYDFCTDPSCELRQRYADYHFLLIDVHWQTHVPAAEAKQERVDVVASSFGLAHYAAMFDRADFFN